MDDTAEPILRRLDELKCFFNAERAHIQSSIRERNAQSALECGFQIAHQTVQSLEILWRSGLAFQMAILTRAFFELGCRLLWASLARDGWKRLLRDECAQLLKDAKRLGSHCPTLPPEIVAQAKTKYEPCPRSLESLLNEISNFPNAFNQCAPRDRTDWHYGFTYGQLSGFVHARLLRISNTSLDDAAGFAVRACEHAIIILLMAAHNAANRDYVELVKRAGRAGFH